MKILWFVRGPVTQEGKHLSSAIASVRYRVLPAARHFHNSGHEVRFMIVGKGFHCSDYEEVLKTDLLIVSKSHYPSSVEPARFSKAHGARILLDVCDNYFEFPKSRDSFLELFQLADHVTASTTTMAEVIDQETGRNATVIDDPYEAHAIQPKFQPINGRVRVLWFGGMMNRLTLVDMLTPLIEFSREVPLLFHVVTDPEGSNLKEVLQKLNEDCSPGLITQFSEWDIETTWQAIEKCDVVVVPSRPEPVYQVKSPNRVVEPLRMGRFVSAYPLPSYRDFGDYTWLGENVVEGIRWAIDHPQDVLARISEGQRYVTEQLDPQKIARRWEEVITSVASNQPKLSRPNFLNQQPVSRKQF